VVNDAIHQVQEYEDDARGSGRRGATTQGFEQYTEDGGNNYREIKIQLAHPNSEALDRAYLASHKALNEHVQRINSSALDRRAERGQREPGPIDDQRLPHAGRNRRAGTSREEVGKAMLALHASTKGRGTGIQDVALRGAEHPRAHAREGPHAA
jgi:hypothetical protein